MKVYNGVIWKDVTKQAKDLWDIFELFLVYHDVFNNGYEAKIETYSDLLDRLEKGDSVYIEIGSVVDCINNLANKKDYYKKVGTLTDAIIIKALNNVSQHYER